MIILELSSTAAHRFEHGFWLFLIAAVSITFLGARYVIAGCRNVDSRAPILLFAWLPVPGLLLALCFFGLLPRLPGYALFAADLAGHAVLLFGYVRPPEDSPSPAGIFGLVSALRAGRTFHPDGTIITGRAWPLPVEPRFAAIAQSLSGIVLLRLGPGIDSRFARQGLHLVNPPNIAARFTSPDGKNLDLLSLSPGTRIREVIPALFTIKRYDYFRNKYSPLVRYLTPDGGPRVWFRLEPTYEPPFSPMDPAGREDALKEAVTKNYVFRVTVRPLDEAEYVPVAEFSFDKFEPDMDQEALAFHPFEGRGFVPCGVFTAVRRIVYPLSVAARPSSTFERTRRRQLSWGQRFALYLNG